MSDKGWGDLKDLAATVDASGKVTVTVHGQAVDDPAFASAIGKLAATLERRRLASELCWACREDLPRDHGRHMVPEDGGRVSRTCDAWADVWANAPDEEMAGQGWEA